jgi:hypothetical protein
MMKNVRLNVALVDLFVATFEFFILFSITHVVLPYHQV